jgi:hypothetical protein
VEKRNNRHTTVNPDTGLQRSTTSLSAGDNNRLSANEYNQIFDREPSFNERKAFVDVFRKQWKDDMGYGSMFNRRKSYKMAKTKSAEALERIQKTKVNHREKVTQRLK